MKFIKNNHYIKSSGFIVCFLIISLCLWSACGEDNGNTATSSKPKTNQEPPKKAEVKKVNVPDFNADSAYLFVQKQVDFGPRTPGSEAQKQCAKWMEQTLGQYVDKVMVQEATVKIHPGTDVPMYNVIGSFNPNASKRVLLCAHWDSRPNADQDDERQEEAILGANDGASGVGVLIEIARQIKSQPLAYGVDIIFFDVEDAGAYQVEGSFCKGSQYWGKTPHIPDYKANYGILLDMVGAGDAIFMKEQYSLKYARPIVEKVWGTAQRLGYGSYFVNQMTPQPITDDHKYVNELRGIPTIDIIHYTPQGEFGAFWHTHDDDMKIIKKHTLKIVGKTVLTVLYEDQEAL